MFKGSRCTGPRWVGKVFGATCNWDGAMQGLHDTVVVHSGQVVLFLYPGIRGRDFGLSWVPALLFASVESVLHSGLGW